MRSDLIVPHGGTLVDRLVGGDARTDALASARQLPVLRLTPVQHSDLLCIATGVFSPLTGFVGSRDYEAILESMRLANGVVFSIPVTLAVSSEEAKALRGASTIALADH